MLNKKTEILKVLVGSHAHGLARTDSDYDYRGVYVVPTTEILSLGFNYKGSHWVEGEEQDNTSYEIGHFLHLATKCNPTILEVFKAPIVSELLNKRQIIGGGYLSETFDWGQRLRELFTYVWNPHDVFNAFVGYGLNQRKKMLDNHLDRWTKYATAYLRTLWNLDSLLRTESFTLEVTNEWFKTELLDIRAGKKSVGEIIDLAENLTAKAKLSLENCKHEPDLVKVNEFLLKIRKEFWE